MTLWMGQIDARDSHFFFSRRTHALKSTYEKNKKREKSERENKKIGDLGLWFVVALAYVLLLVLTVLPLSPSPLSPACCLSRFGSLVVIVV